MTMRWCYLLMAIFSVLIASLAQILLKKGAMMTHTSFVKEYFNIWVVGGYLIMGSSLLINIFAMSRGIKLKEISIVESFSYLFVPILSYLFFKENITPRKIVSIIIIMVGITLFFL